MPLKTIKNYLTREGSENFVESKLSPTPTLVQELSNNHDSDLMYDRATLTTKYLAFLNKFNKLWTELQQKQERMQITHGYLKELQAIMINENLPLPSELPPYRLVECKLDQGDSAKNQIFIRHDQLSKEDLENCLKMVMKEKEDLVIKLIQLNSYIKEMENQYELEHAEKGETIMDPLPKESNTQVDHESVRSRQNHLSMQDNEILKGSKVNLHNDTQTESQSEYDCEKLKLEMEILNGKCQYLTEKLSTANLKINTLKKDQTKWMKKMNLLENRKSELETELCVLTDEDNSVLTEVRFYLKKVKNENNSLKNRIKVLKQQFSELSQHNHLAVCNLSEKTKREAELEKTIEELEKKKKELDIQCEMRNRKEDSMMQIIRNLINTLEVDKYTMRNISRPLIQIEDISIGLVQHMKLVYNAFSEVYKCKTEHEKRIKIYASEILELNCLRQKLESRLEKLSNACKSFHIQCEEQSKKLMLFDELQDLVIEKTAKCEQLENDICDMESLIVKLKERKRIFKKKYLKEKALKRNVRPNKTKKHSNNWLTKFLEWRPPLQLKN